MTRCARWILACLLILLSVFWSTDNAAAAPRDANFRLPAYSYDMVDSASVGTAPVTLRGPPVTVEAELGNGSGVAAAAHTRYDGSTYTYARTSTPTLPRTVAAAHWRGSPGLSLPSPWRTPDSGLRFGVAAKTADSFLTGLPKGAPKPLGLGLTGRVEPANLTEQLAMTAVRSEPAGVVLRRVSMTDARCPATEGWVKMQRIESGVNIHYVRNTVTGAVDDCKFK